MRLLVGLGLGAVVTMILVVVARRRRGGRGERIWWLLPGVVLGPSYALACVLVMWRKPRWASWMS